MLQYSHFCVCIVLLRVVFHFSSDSDFSTKVLFSYISCYKNSYFKLRAFYPIAQQRVK